MSVQVSDTEFVSIASPITLQLNVIRNTLASANTGTFRIYNLKPETRNRIFHDRNSTTVLRKIKVQAGYEDESPLPTIFLGDIQTAYSSRQGADWVTEIQAFDSGLLAGGVST